MLNHWVLGGQPYPAQTEAIARSWYGLSFFTDDNKLRPNAIQLPHWPKPARGWAHFMEMRVGKTPVALNEFELYRKRVYPNPVRALILAPNQYKYQWAQEATSFGIHVPTEVYESSRKDWYRAWARSVNTGILVANYEALTYTENRLILAEWVSRHYSIMVMDESAMIKNPKSGFFKHSFQLSKHANLVRILSGLPTPQGPQDLWSQMRIIHQFNNMNFYVFKRMFCEQKPGYQGRMKVVGTRNEEELDKKLFTCAFKARRKDWSVKFDTDYELVNLQMTPTQKAHYKTMDQEFIVWLEGGDAITAGQVTTKHMKLQQISSGFVYAEDGNMCELEPFNKLPKFKNLKERLSMFVRGKVIIVAHYKYTIDNLLRHLKSFNPALIAGNEKMRELGLDIKYEKLKFNEDPECRILIGQGMALKYGHTLMGLKDDPCESICFFENTYSLDTRAQVEERNQGHGQQKGIHIWDYSSSEVEEKIVRALQRKKSIAAAIMSYYGRPAPPGAEV